MKLKFIVGIVGIVGCTLLGLSTSFQISEPALALPAPRTCASRKNPTKGAPTLAQAKAYFICGSELSSTGVGADSVTIVRNVQMEMSSKPIFVNAANVDNVREAISSSRENITVDVKKPLYPIRGSLASYTCGVKSSTCLEYIIVGAKGFCFVDDFGDWHCKMKGNFGANPRNNVPLPANE
jgi:hypothetical protein